MGWVRGFVALWAGALPLWGCAPEREAPQEATPVEIAGDSEAGFYRVSLRPVDGEVPLGALHAWVVVVETAAGESFEPTRLAFGGGMPQHQHGFVTEPRVTRVLGPGEYLIEGVKFHMAGDWALRVEVVGPDGPDVAVLHVMVGP